jgi:hypothetical protein
VEEALTERVRISNYATIEHGRNSRIYLEFRSATAQEMDDWHKSSLKFRMATSTRPLFYFALFVFDVIGIRSLLNYGQAPHVRRVVTGNDRPEPRHRPHRNRCSEADSGPIR